VGGGGALRYEQRLLKEEAIRCGQGGAGDRQGVQGRAFWGQRIAASFVRWRTRDQPQGRRGIRAFQRRSGQGDCCRNCAKG